MLTIVTALALLALPDAGLKPKPDGPFAQRGYYITFMRMPTLDLADWRRIVDSIHEDGGNTLLLWVGGAFRSEQYPITWKYNAEHENVRKDFVNELIGHAHAKGIKVMLGFTPFGYDGVNQYSLEHPELRAIGKDGKPVTPFGIGCWGYNLCPSRPESQRFMLDYSREIVTRYPKADGLLIESSDYAICHCEDCRGHFFEKEFRFVKTISEETWAKKPDATVIVFPHYFSGAQVPGFGVKAAKLPFDPRWSLVFTPHSSNPEPALIKQARSSLWWDDSPSLRSPREIQAGARRAREIGTTGYVPSLEAFTFVATENEEGQTWLKGTRQIPLGFGWIDPTNSPFDELPVRVNRIAYREFSRDPSLAFDEYKSILGRELLGNATNARAIDDLLELQSALNAQRTWCQPSPITSPARVRAMANRGELTPRRKGEFRDALERLKAIEARHQRPNSEGERDLLRITRWVIARWDGEALKMLNADR